MIKITQHAQTQLLKLLQCKQSKLVLFSVQGGGCNGFKYSLEPVHTTTKNKFDEDIMLSNEHKLRICEKSLMYLIGTEIDWENDFMGQRFIFKNPNTAATCGCGSTFTPK